MKKSLFVCILHCSLLLNVSSIRCARQVGPNPSSDYSNSSNQDITIITIKELNEYNEASKKLKKKYTLDKSFYHGALSSAGTGRLLEQFSSPLATTPILIAISATAVCFLLQDYYWVSKDEKDNTSPAERIVAQAKGALLFAAADFAVHAVRCLSVE